MTENWQGKEIGEQTTMNNVDKVTTSLECCLVGLCDQCDYKNSNGPGGCRDELMLDALNLIKAQKPYVMTRKCTTGLWHWWTSRPIRENGYELKQKGDVNWDA